jgi:hypothetical protein
VSFRDVSLTRLGPDPDAENGETTTCRDRLFELCVNGTAQGVAHSDVVSEAACDDNLCRFEQLLQVGRGGLLQRVAGNVNVPDRRVSDTGTSSVCYVFRAVRTHHEPGAIVIASSLS